MTTVLKVKSNLALSVFSCFYFQEHILFIKINIPPLSNVGMFPVIDFDKIETDIYLEQIHQ